MSFNEDIYKESFHDWLCERDLNDERPDPSEYLDHPRDNGIVSASDFAPERPTSDPPF